MEKYGCHPRQTEAVKEKFRETCRRKYGVDHVMQVPWIFNKQRKSAFSYKEYTHSSGRKVLVQGYEGFCLDDLTKREGYSEDQIINEMDDLDNKMPEVWYDFQEKEHRYYPDIFIPSENRIIEVKSVYTLNVDLERNIAKAEACKELGYNFEFRIYDKKGNIVEIIKI